MTKTKICNYTKKNIFFSFIFAIISFSSVSLWAIDKNWTLGAESFSLSQKDILSQSSISYAKMFPSLILEQMAENLSRMPRSQEQLDRVLYDLQKERLSLFLQLSKEVKTRDSLVLESYSSRKLKSKTKEIEIKIKDIEDKIDENLHLVAKEKERKRENIIQDEQRSERLENGSIVDDSKMKKNNFRTFFKDFTNQQNDSPIIESVALYKNDFTQLFDVGIEAKSSGYKSYLFEKACVDAGIQGLITGNITIYGNYVSVAVTLYQYPGGRVIANVVDVGITGELKNLVISIASQLTPKIADSMPVELNFEILPKEAQENAIITIDDVVYSDNFDKIVIPSGVHTIVFSSDGFSSESTSYSFTGNRLFNISVNMKEDNPGEVVIGIKKAFSGNIFANGLFYGSMGPENRFSNIYINNHQILGHFVSEDGESCDFLIRSKYLVDGQNLILNIKPFNRSNHIEKRRVWMYRSYSLLIVSLMPTFYCYGNYIATGTAYNDNYGVSYEDANKWRTAYNVTAGISIGCGTLFLVELIRYLKAANTVLPSEVKKMSDKQLTKIKMSQQEVVEKKLSEDIDVILENENSEQVEKK